jgi:hypothetical protein
MQSPKAEPVIVSSPAMPNTTTHSASCLIFKYVVLRLAIRSLITLHPLKREYLLTVIPYKNSSQ